MDTVSKEKRSKIMSAIHSRDTLPEVVVRKMLWENGYRRRARKGVDGRWMEPHRHLGMRSQDGEGPRNDICICPQESCGVGEEGVGQD